MSTQKRKFVGISAVLILAALLASGASTGTGPYDLALRIAEALESAATTIGGTVVGASGGVGAYDLQLRAAEAAEEIADRIGSLDQGAATAFSSVTNYVANLTDSAGQVLTISGTTNNVTFIHATNNAAGLSRTYLIDPTTNTECVLTIPGTWFLGPLTAASVTVTNGTIGRLHVYGYGSNNTNILADYTAFTK